jgi:hypothetical protein
VGGLGSAIATNWFDEFGQFQKFKVIVIIWLVCSVAADLTITTTLVWFLVGFAPFIPLEDPF